MTAKTLKAQALETQTLGAQTLEARAIHVPNHRLTTAEILYHLPDHPRLLQTYLWQDFDVAPEFPMLRKFLDFWESNLDGRLHSVRVASLGLAGREHWRHADACLQLQ